FTELARDYARLALSYRDFIENHKNHKLSLLLGIEGLHPFKGRLEKIEEYHKRGVRVFTLTWNNPNEFADSAENAFKNGKDFGLTPLGKECVKLINDMGGIIDLAHSSRRTFFDTIEISKKPPIVSHAGLSSARELYRNIDDKELLALKDKRGIAAVFFIPEYLNPSGEPKITLDDIVKCYKHIVDVAGIDCAAVGTDFDGTNNLPEGIRGAQDIWKLTKSLLESGFDELSVKKILGLNFLRIFKEACP
ncbi:MAG: dipeptidase, partial [bacterium]